MPNKLPAFQFYTGDFLKDPNLSMCSPGTRGVWIDLLCAMHESDRSGKITGTREQLSRLSRCTAVEFDHALIEIKSTNTADVTERDGIVTLVNRRMSREYKTRKDAANRKVAERQRKMSQNGHSESHKEVTPYSSSSPSSSPSVNKEEREGASRFSPPALEEVTFHAEKIGLPKAEAEKFLNFYASKGWKVGKTPMKSWHHAIGGWKIRWETERKGGRPEGNQRVENLQVKML